MGEKTWDEKLAAARRRFARVGYSQRRFAEELGVSPALVGMVLAGKKKCVRGDSHRIAVALGLKEGLVVPKGTTAFEALQLAEGESDAA